MILISKTFKKDLWKIKSINISDIKLEIKKHDSWLDNFKCINKTDNSLILKWYLLSKKVRILIYFTRINWNYIPYYIVKKESKFWKNIRNEMIDLVEHKLEKAICDIDNKDFEIIEV